MKSTSLPGVRLSGSGLYLCPQRQVYGQPPCRPSGVMQPVWRHMAASYHSRRRMLQPCTSAHAAQKSCGNEAGKLTAAMPCEGRYGIKEKSGSHVIRTWLPDLFSFISKSPAPLSCLQLIHTAAQLLRAEERQTNGHEILARVGLHLALRAVGTVNLAHVILP